MQLMVFSLFYEFRTRTGSDKDALKEGKLWEIQIGQM